MFFSGKKSNNRAITVTYELMVHIVYIIYIGNISIVLIFIDLTS
jgi:hypothetical protein